MSMTALCACCLAGGWLSSYSPSGSEGKGMRVVGANLLTPWTLSSLLLVVNPNCYSLESRTRAVCRNP